MEWPWERKRKEREAAAKFTAERYMTRKQRALDLEIKHQEEEILKLEARLMRKADEEELKLKECPCCTRLYVVGEHSWQETTDSRGVLRFRCIDDQLKVTTRTKSAYEWSKPITVDQVTPEELDYVRRSILGEEA